MRGIVGGRALGDLLRLELGHPPHRRAEPGIADQLGQLHPRVDLLGLGVLRQLRQRGPHPRLEGGVHGEPGERLVDEVGDDAPPLLVGQPGELVHEFDLLGAGSSFGDGPQHGAAQPERADPHVQRLGVRGRDLRDEGVELLTTLLAPDRP
ncbi:MAG: hypothetical protein FWJ90_08105 [Actinomadura sp.]